MSPSILREKQKTLTEQLVHPGESNRPNPQDIFYNRDPVSSRYAVIRAKEDSISKLIPSYRTRHFTASTNSSRRSH